jgi:DNA-3-methyladenine glycosylase
MKVLSRSFYERDTALVAKELLGKILVRKLNKRKLSGIIVETEAYYGKEDPASRAFSGRPKYCAKLLYDMPGKALVYNVHNNWLFNIVAHEKGKVGAVLIRAVEPLEGIEEMKKNRRKENIYELTNGPGKLSKALRITKELNGIFVTDKRSEVTIIDNKLDFVLGKSKRIGVTRDLPVELRFFIKDNPFVSKNFVIRIT